MKATVLLVTILVSMAIAGRHHRHHHHGDQYGYPYQPPTGSYGMQPPSYGQQYGQPGPYEGYGQPGPYQPPPYGGQPIPQYGSPYEQICRGRLGAVPGMDTWCQQNCAQGYCPQTHCICS